MLVGGRLPHLSRRIASSAARRMSTSISYETCDVFTTEQFGGNPLAVIFSGEHSLTDERMLKIAQEFNYSETTFVLPPKDPGNTARVRIFTPACELPFAGHPNVGTACLLARRGQVFGKDLSGVSEVVFEEQAGNVRIALLHEGASGSACVGAVLTAPQPFAQLGTVPHEDVAAALGLEAADLVASSDPVVGTTGGPYILAELASRDALERVRPVPPAFAASSAMQQHMPSGPKILAWLPVAEPGLTHRARMVTWQGREDPATGAANCVLAGLLASRSDEGAGVGGGTLELSIAQGVEMGRPSRLLAEADHDGKGGVSTVRIGGICVPVMKGQLELRA